jgi:hypothetical protein
VSINKIKGRGHGEYPVIVDQARCPEGVCSLTHKGIIGFGRLKTCPACVKQKRRAIILCVF